MKRAILPVLITAVCITGFLSMRGTLPFIPVADASMEPALESGSLLMISTKNPQEIKAGDIIVCNVPSTFRDYYNYPPAIARRVISVDTYPSLSFQTAGDNTGADPFTVQPQEVRGTTASQIPYLGLPLLLFRSTQGLVATVIVLALLTIFLYRGEIMRAGSALHRGMFAPVIDEERRTSRILTQKIETTERRMGTTEQALEKFASAIGDYAQHLASHTSAIQGLADASQELKTSAADQNRVLSYMLETIEQFDKGEQKTAARTPESEPEPIIVMPEDLYRAESKGIFGKPMPPGCALSRETRAKAALAAQKEIYNALDKLYAGLDDPENQV